MSTKMIIIDDCSINLILGEFKKSQSDEIPKQRITNEKIKIYLSKFSKLKMIKIKTTNPPIRGIDSLPANFWCFLKNLLFKFLKINLQVKKITNKNEYEIRYCIISFLKS